MDDKTVIAGAPPPPSEVKIRTMQSDIESMMKSGGGAPSFRNVNISGLSTEKKAKIPMNFVSTPMPVGGAIQRPATENQFPASSADAPEREVIGREVSDAGPGSDSGPILIVLLVAAIALVVVGYFAYTLFIK